ncbi:oxidoreductase [Dehalobacter sp. DCM]|uniref:oxidoreductase n=1 Tax=Dehalobacter sp. DCM TaxID=2907827 RepID=UPI00308158F7
MYKTAFPYLFSPIKLGNTVFRNRIFAAPNGFHHLTPERFPSAESIAFFERKARGGVAAVTVGEAIVDTKTGQAHAYQMVLDNELALPHIAAYAIAMTKHGAIPSIELMHCGMFSHYVYEKGLPLLGPSETFLPDVHKVNNDGHETKASEDGMRHIYEMTEEQILALAASFGKAAAFVKRCGVGMVMIHAGHGWALSQFMSPHFNTRKDRWGGSLENRMRLPLAVIESVRKAVGPGFPIEVRISADELTPTGYGLDDGIKIAMILDGKVDLINTSVGNHEFIESNIYTHPSMFLEDGCNVKYAAEIKKYVKNTPISTVGALSDPAMMEEIIASGKADVIQLGRQTLADPDFPFKARIGKVDEINTCLRCCLCYASGVSFRQRCCSTNPEIGHEIETKFDIPPAHKKTVLIAGGGVGGMQAALTASRRGHNVILCEKGDSLGGVLKCEKDVSFKKHLDEYLKRQALLISRSPIEVRLNTIVTPELANSIAPDVIIAAMGSRPLIPKIPGINGENVIGAEEAYYNLVKVGQKVAILGGGLVGVELGIHLAENGREVTIIEMMPVLNDGGNMVHANALGIKIAERGIKLALTTKAEEINRKGVIGQNAEGTKLYEADTVIYAVGQSPLFDEANALRFCAPEFHQIGDCLTPKNIQSATQAAFTASRDIGKY